MTKIARRWRTVLLGVPVAAALSFGGAQAFAAPGSAAPGNRCLPDVRCDAACPVAGGFPVSSTGVCRCCPF